MLNTQEILNEASVGLPTQWIDYWRITNRLCDEIDRLEKNLSGLCQSIAITDEMFRQSQEENERLKEQLTEWQQAASHQSLMVALHKSTIDRLQRTEVQLNGQLALIERCNSNQASNVRKYREENEQLKEQLVIRKASVSNQADALRECRGEIKQLNEKLAEALEQPTAYKYRKKPVIVEAFQMTEGARDRYPLWPVWLRDTFVIGSQYRGKGKFWCDYDDNGRLYVGTIGGHVEVSFNDWIVRGVKGELDVCKPDIFEVTYEAVQSPPKKRG